MKTFNTVLSTAILGALLTTAHAATIRVPQDQLTITAGVAAAQEGDTIAVGAGTYNEFNIQITNAITVTSLSGPTNTIIDSQHNGRSFVIANGTLASVKLIGLTIQNGYVNQIRGGAIFVAAGQCTISNCIIQGVSGDSAYSSIPISNENTNVSAVVVENSIIRNNFAANFAGIGNSVVRNCLIYGNTGGNNAAVLFVCNATNCTVYGNTGGFYAGGMYLGNAVNCIFWGDKAPEIWATPSPSVTYCIIQGGFAGTGNLSTDPLFVNAASGDFHLQTNSPGVNAGDSSIFDADGTRSDMGAYGGILTYCSPHKATATASLVNGSVVGATIIDPGCGYTNAPTVLIQSGGGSGATATAVVSNGVVVAININSGGCCYTNVPRIVIGSPPFVPTVSIAFSRVNVTQHVVLGRNYILESSMNLVDWVATGPQFTADSEDIVNEFILNQTGQYFRIHQVP